MSAQTTLPPAETPSGASGVHALFCRIARTYELANHALTLGLDVIWRNRAASIAAGDGGQRWLDVCTGTGDMARALRKRAPQDTLVVGLDFCLPMLQHAKDPTPLVLSDARTMPFADNTFDLLTVSFATRNLRSADEALLATLREFHRVLKPGGRYVNVETSQPPCPLVRWAFHTFVAVTVRALGGRIAGAGAPYGYLAHTIPRFHGAPELAQLISRAGFEDVTYRRMTLGAAAVHRAVKPR